MALIPFLLLIRPVRGGDDGVQCGDILHLRRIALESSDIRVNIFSLLIAQGADWKIWHARRRIVGVLIRTKAKKCNESRFSLEISPSPHKCSSGFAVIPMT